MPESFEKPMTPEEAGRLAKEDAARIIAAAEKKAELSTPRNSPEAAGATIEVIKNMLRDIAKARDGETRAAAERALREFKERQHDDLKPYLQMVEDQARTDAVSEKE